MPVAPLPAPVQAFAPDFARRLGLILATLAALIARRFLREPRLAAGHPSKPRHAGSGGPHPRATALPTGRFWLIRALGPEAAACATQLQALLAEPAAAGLLAEVPAAGRILRPLVRLLAIGAVAPRQRPARAAPASPSGEVAFRSAGFTWYVVPTPPANPA